MKSYAGIGSRDISTEEINLIQKLANLLSDNNYICYSGNADGSDINFQRGSKGKCVIFLPWNNFNFENYHPVRDDSIDWFVVGETLQGDTSVYKFHPNPSALSTGGLKLMTRNYHQVMGYDIFPKIDFILCCANEDNNGNILGGTGQACRIAKSENIPVINIRNKEWKNKLSLFLNIDNIL